MKIIDCVKMNLQMGGPTNTIVLTVNGTSVTLIMDVMLYQLGHGLNFKNKDAAKIQN